MPFPPGKKFGKKKGPVEMRFAGKKALGGKRGKKSPMVDRLSEMKMSGKFGKC